METIYLVIVIILFLLAASDLIVGVSNDAVNFLNSAIGSRVASFKVIMAVAAVGVLFGAVFSSGMMEVARKGIMNPGMFTFEQIMFIFLAVMITDVILLDVYNTVGLPTSTTVSIVFELLGASVGMASIVVLMNSDGNTVGEFINSSKALAIIFGIFLSVIIAFSVGAMIQYLTRIAFSFNFKRRMKYFGAIWGGIAFTAMTYFLLIKGAKEVTFMTSDMKTWISAHSGTIIMVSFVGWTILLQLFYMLFKLNILKLIVLVGTFSLAMAFAGNDLVNFIGVPIAGYNSYELFVAAEGAQADSFLMSGLAGKVPTPTLFLILAGLVMVITLYTSKKAKSVVQTSLDLSRQTEGEERFKSTWVSKLLVRYSINMSTGVKRIIPNRIVEGIERQFEPSEETAADPNPPTFDLIRASVNLTVASVLIAFGTSLKLPLSTTYVTFMVAMGTSLSDKAWDRESAVYRISGVLAVVGGWFLTAVSAFFVAFIFAYVFNYGGIIAIIASLILAGYLMYRTHAHHKKSKENKKEEAMDVQAMSDENIAEKSNKTIIKNLKKISVELERTILGLEKEDVRELKKAKAEIQKITAKTKYLKDHINVIVDKLKEETLDSAYFFVTTLDYMREMLHSITFIVNPSVVHVDNNHKPLIEVQIQELRDLEVHLNKMIAIVVKSITKHDFSTQKELLELEQAFLDLIKQVNKNQIKRLKNGEVGTKSSILFLNIINEIKNLSLQLINLYKSQRDFINFKNGSKL
ncbi:MAG: inorganic phosphate transporter [Bacteroidetes bacterium]|nr:inorganic phosphate transporter [Bacteroidota bacterium]